MTKKLRVKDDKTSVNHVSLYDLEADSVEEFQENINQLLIGISVDAKFSIDNDEESDWLTITSFRDETDKEMEKRLGREKNKRDKQKCYNDKLAQKQKAQELNQLEALAKKYAFELKKKDPDAFEE